jgi:hypothetical protein
VKALAALGLLLLGAGTAVATVGVHDRVWGFVLATVATVLTAYALPAGWWSRLAFVVGWDGMLAWLTVPRPEGDYLISQDWQGYAVLAVGLLLLVSAIATLPRPGVRGA